MQLNFCSFLLSKCVIELIPSLRNEPKLVILHTHKINIRSLDEFF